MDSELAPEFIYDQGLYYPATGYYCGYAYTGMLVDLLFYKKLSLHRIILF